MFVGKPRINYICLKKKRKNPADIMLNKAYLKSCCLSPCMKRKCQQKTLTWLQFCGLLQEPQLQYLQMSGLLISPSSAGARCPLEFSKDRSLGVLNKVLYREAPPQGPTSYPLIYTISDRKGTSSVYLLMPVVPLSHAYFRPFHPSELL